MTRARTVYSLFFLAFVFTIQSDQLKAMENSVSSSSQSICKGCFRYYEHNLNVNSNLSCHHHLCSLCLPESIQDDASEEQRTLLRKVYNRLTDFECSYCNISITIGSKKRFDQGSDLDLLEELYAELGHPFNLFSAIKLVAQQRTKAQTAELLQRALANRGRTLCNIKDKYGRTLLFYILYENLDILKYIKIALKAAGNQAWNLICEQDNWNSTVLVVAASKHETQVVKKLLSVAPNNKAIWEKVFEIDADSNSPLLLAVYNKKDKLSTILESYFDVKENTADHCNDDNLDNYLYEKLSQSLRSVELLLDAVELVKKWRSPEVAITLLKKALDKKCQSLCNIMAKGNNTALHIICKDIFSITYIKIMLQVAGPRAWDFVCMTNDSDCTALHYAIRYCPVNVVKELLSKAPNDEQRLQALSQKNKDGDSVFAIAQKYRVCGLPSFLKQYQSKELQ